MKKVYSLKKEILFKNNIYDILSIAIDKKFSLDGYAIKGQFKINGEYLVRENEHDDFDIDLPYLNYIEDIYDISKIKVDIDDFYYEIKDSNKLVINIDIVVDGLKEKEETRCIDSEIDELVEDAKEEKLEINDIEEKDYEIKDEGIIENNVKIVNGIEKEDIDKNREISKIDINSSVEEAISSKERKDMPNEYFESKENKEFVTYKICIVREGDTLESIVEKYGSTIESIKKYNVINELKNGDKIIIPYERS